MPAIKRPVSYAAQLAPAVVLAVVLAAVLAGCSSAADPEARPASGPTVVTPHATASPAPTPVAPPPTGLPKGAAERTEAGATAFVTHYFAAVNTAWQGPKTKVLPAYALSSCRSCAKYELTAAELTRSKRHYNGTVLALKEVAGTTQAKPTDESYVVEAHFQQLKVSLVDASGRTVSTEEPFDGTLLFHLAYVDGWRISEIETKA